MIFSHIIDRFQLKFKDREAAGNILAESLKNSIKKEEMKNTIGDVLNGLAETNADQESEDK